MNDIPLYIIGYPRLSDINISTISETKTGASPLPAQRFHHPSTPSGAVSDGLARTSDSPEATRTFATHLARNTIFLDEKTSAKANEIETTTTLPHSLCTIFAGIPASSCRDDRGISPQCARQFTTMSHSFHQDDKGKGCLRSRKNALLLITRYKSGNYKNTPKFAEFSAKEDLTRKNAATRAENCQIIQQRIAHRPKRARSPGPQTSSFSDRTSATHG